MGRRGFAAPDIEMGRRGFTALEIETGSNGFQTWNVEYWIRKFKTGELDSQQKMRNVGFVNPERENRIHNGKYGTLDS
jgi:hypothetical protein